MQMFETRHDFQAFFISYNVRGHNFMFLLHHPIWAMEQEVKSRYAWMTVKGLPLSVYIYILNVVVVVCFFVFA